MWAAWDFALDLCLIQLPGVLEEQAANQAAAAAAGAATNGNNNIPETAVTSSYIPSPFFEEQLTAFQVWLDHGSESRRHRQSCGILISDFVCFRFRSATPGTTPNCAPGPS